jgi:alkyldihydroxyacetonephosphate synthase
MGERKRSWWGWGWEDEAIPLDQLERMAAGGRTAAMLGDNTDILRPPPIAELELRAPRVKPPDALDSYCSTADEDRVGHTFGKAYRDVIRALRGDVGNAPDVVAFPTDEAQVVALLDWCASANVAAVPYGGGSSVVGGVECDAGDRYAGVVSIDLTGLDKVLEIDRTSRAARIQGGALGPVLEEQLKPHGYTLRHFPQSFEFSTLGGWLATRSGGHFATVYTHIDDLLESMRVVTPNGTVESRRLPGSGAGPSPDRMFLGSEGTMGIITEAWMRIQDRPRFRASASVRFASFEAGVAAARAVSQSGLFPTNCQLLDAGEAGNAGVTDGATVLLVGFESADHPVDAWTERAVECCADHGGTVPEGVRTSSTDQSLQGAGRAEGTAETWRNSFIRAPYGRDAAARLGLIADTFETSITWDRFDALHDGVTAAVKGVLADVCGGGTVTCRFTHVYPDGPAPYFTILAAGRRGEEVEQWDAIKRVAADAVIEHGGTITHHHAVGRDHRPWYDRQRPEVFADALRAAKRAVDPAGIMNPGVLIDPVR